MTARSTQPTVDRERAGRASRRPRGDPRSPRPHANGSSGSGAREREPGGEPDRRLHHRRRDRGDRRPPPRHARAARTPPSGCTLRTTASAASRARRRRASSMPRTHSSAAMGIGDRRRTAARSSSVATGCSTSSTPRRASGARSASAVSTSHAPLASTRIATLGPDRVAHARHDVEVLGARILTFTARSRRAPPGRTSVVVDERVHRDVASRTRSGNPSSAASSAEPHRRSRGRTGSRATASTPPIPPGPSSRVTSRSPTRRRCSQPLGHVTRPTVPARAAPRSRPRGAPCRRERPTSAGGVERASRRRTVANASGAAPGTRGAPTERPARSGRSRRTRRRRSRRRCGEPRRSPHRTASVRLPASRVAGDVAHVVGEQDGARQEADHERAPPRGRRDPLDLHERRPRRRDDTRRRQHHDLAETDVAVRQGATRVEHRGGDRGDADEEQPRLDEERERRDRRPRPRRTRAPRPTRPRPGSRARRP